MLDRITPVLLTLNEAPNIARTLSALSWARDVVIVDSNSSDETRAIAASFDRVRTFERAFDSHAEQWNYALTATGIETEWVLAVDADYVLSAELVDELSRLRPAEDVCGYRARFVYRVAGRALRNAVYPPVAVLYRRAAARYVQDGHTQRVALSGRVEELTHPIYHDDRKPLRRWLASQSRYMELEARKLSCARFSQLSIQDRVRKLIVVAPGAMFLYCMFARGNILDGRAGLFYALQRTVAEGILSLYLAERFVGSASERK